MSYNQDRLIMADYAEIENRFFNSPYGYESLAQSVRRWKDEGMSDLGLIVTGNATRTLKGNSQSALEKAHGPSSGSKRAKRRKGNK